MIHNPIEKSHDASVNSSNRYKEVDLSTADFLSSPSFKALHVGGDGDVTITGVDGVTVTMNLTAGLWPYGGTAIVRATTTATDIVALY